jgi:proteasome accessory factor B
VIGRAGIVQRPESVNLMEYVLGASDERRTATTALVWAAAGKAHGLRRRAKVVGSRTVGGVVGDELEIELDKLESAAGWLAGHGPDIAVLEPEVLRKSVRERLLGVLDAGRREAGEAREAAVESWRS